MIAMPVTAAVGSALSGYILSLDGTLGLKGWQWLFLLEGLPSAILGLVVFYYLDDTPEKATWLTAEEKRRSAADACRGAQGRSGSRNPAAEESLFQRTHFVDGHQVRGRLFLPGQYPGHGRGLDAADRQEFQRRREQQHHRPAGGDSAGLHDHRHDLVGTALRSQAGAQMAHRVPMLFSAAGWLLHGLFRHTPPSSCWASASPRPAPTPPCRSSGRPRSRPEFPARAVGIAVINATGNIGSALNPVVVGWLKDLTQSFTTGLIYAAVLLVIGAFVVLTLPIQSAPKRA